MFKGSVVLRRQNDEEEVLNVRIAHISDTHDRDYDDKVPAGDILVHSGDFTNSGREEEIRKFASFLSRQPHRYKIVVCGNHEKGLDKLSTEEVARLLGDDVIVLEESGVTVLGIKFWGSPSNSTARGAYRATAEERERIWQQIPNDTDVLITHQPPYGIKDLAWLKVPLINVEPCALCNNGNIHRRYAHWGCESLLKRINELKIPLHLFGHVHDEVGIKEKDGTVFCNAAMDIDETPCMLDISVPVARLSGEQWPTHKLIQNISVDETSQSSVFRGDSTASSKPKAVLLTTGAMNPIHRGHLTMMERSKHYLENVLGYSVIGGFFSPSSDIYVKPKMMRCRRQSEPLEASYADSTHRIRLTQKAVSDSNWLSCSTWEAEQQVFRDFDEVQIKLDQVLHEKNIFLSENDKVFYVCGSDHFKKCGLQNGIHGIDGVTRPVVVISRAEDEVAGFTSSSEHAIIIPPEYYTAVSSTLYTDVSSTKVRNLLNTLPVVESTCFNSQDEGELNSSTLTQLREMLPPAVFEDVLSSGNSLYRVSNNEK